MDVSNDMLRHMKTDFLNTVYNLILEAALSRTLAPEHYLLSLHLPIAAKSQLSPFSSFPSEKYLALLVSVVA